MGSVMPPRANPRSGGGGERRPDANLGVATGWPGPDVLDVDQHGPAGNGFGACHRLEAAGLLDGAAAVVVTPGGGLHYYFSGTEQASRRLPHHHLDLRSKGGYVLAPPSQIDGRSYRLVTSGQRSAYLRWSAVADLLEPHRRPLSPGRPASPVQGSRLLRWVEQLEPGNRNCGLFWAACRAVEAGQLDLLDKLAVAAASTGLSSLEVSRTIASARRRADRSARWQAGSP